MNNLLDSKNGGALARLAATGLLAIVLLLAQAGCTSGAASLQADQTADLGELDNVEKSGVLVIATDAAYPPQSQFNKDAPRAADTRCDLTQYTASQMEGYDIDVAAEIARRMGVEACFVTPTWSQIVGGNWGDRWDINVGSMVITPERMEKLYFTQPYISGEAVLYIHKDNQTYKTVSDLSGKRIGVCSGCAYESYLKGTLVIPTEKIDFQIRNAQIVGYDTDTSALADLAVGDGTNLDGILTDPDTGKTAIAQGLPVKQLGGPLYHDYSGVTVDKNSVGNPIPLVERITAIIQEMHADGTLLQMSYIYYGGDFTTPAAKFDIQALKQFP